MTERQGLNVRLNDDLTLDAGSVERLTDAEDRLDQADRAIAPPSDRVP